MSDFSFDFSDPTQYSGLSDTAAGFTGDSSAFDVTAGSPLNLYMPSDNFSADVSTSVLDGINGLSPEQNLSLSGVTDPFSSWFSSSDSSPFQFPLSGSSGQSTDFGLSSLAKFGSSIASLFGSHPTTVQQVAPMTGTRTGGTVTAQATVNGSTTTILLVALVAVAILLMRGE